MNDETKSNVDSEADAIHARAVKLAEALREIRAENDRLRKAVESGLEDPSAMSAKQPKGKKRNNQVTRSNEAVDPQLPDEVMARLIKLQKR